MKYLLIVLFFLLVVAAIKADDVVEAKSDVVYISSKGPTTVKYIQKIVVDGSEYCYIWGRPFSEFASCKIFQKVKELNENG